MVSLLRRGSSEGLPAASTPLRIPALGELNLRAGSASLRPSFPNAGPVQLIAALLPKGAE